VDTKQLETLTTALTSIGLLTRDADGRLSNPPTVEAFLSGSNPAWDFGDYLRFQVPSGLRTVYVYVCVCVCGAYVWQMCVHVILGLANFQNDLGSISAIAPQKRAASPPSTVRSSRVCALPLTCAIVKACMPVHRMCWNRDDKLTGKIDAWCCCRSTSRCTLS